MDQAKEIGAIKTISLRNELDLAFNTEGVYLGSFTDQINSWQPKPGNALTFITK
jgi:hypothetical protein